MREHTHVLVWREMKDEYKQKLVQITDKEDYPIWASDETATEQEGTRCLFIFIHKEMNKYTAGHKRELSCINCTYSKGPSIIISTALVSQR